MNYKTARYGGVEVKFNSPKIKKPHKMILKDMLCAAGKVISAEFLKRIYD